MREKKYNIKRRMWENSLTLPDMSRLLGVSETSLSVWCNIPADSRRSIPGDKIRQMAKLFDCTFEELHNTELEWEPEPQKELV